MYKLAKKNDSWARSTNYPTTPNIFETYTGEMYTDVIYKKAMDNLVSKHSSSK